MRRNRNGRYPWTYSSHDAAFGHRFRSSLLSAQCLEVCGEMTGDLFQPSRLRAFARALSLLVFSEPSKSTLISNHKRAHSRQRFQFSTAGRHVATLSKTADVVREPCDAWRDVSQPRRLKYCTARSCFSAA